jgi:hypothetical protein
MEQRRMAMTTQEFISKTYNVPATRERKCSSVFTDYEGVVYSYGYHYPLAFHLKGLDFVNVRGYSSTTAKHICWAKQAMNYEYIGVKLSSDDVFRFTRGYATDEQKLHTIKKALAREWDSISEQLRSKKRTDTQVYADLAKQLNQVTQYTIAVNKVLA